MVGLKKKKVLHPSSISGVCIYREEERGGSGQLDYGRRLEMGRASGSHFLTPCSLRAPHEELFFFFLNFLLYNFRMQL